MDAQGCVCGEPPLWYDRDIPRLNGSSVCGEGSGALLPFFSQDGGGRGKRETESDEGREVHLPIEMYSHTVLPLGLFHADLVGQNPGPLDAVVHFPDKSDRYIPK